jgi:hypothetical protein
MRAELLECKTHDIITRGITAMEGMVIQQCELAHTLYTLLSPESARELSNAAEWRSHEPPSPNAEIIIYTPDLHIQTRFS